MNSKQTIINRIRNNRYTPVEHPGYGFEKIVFDDPVQKFAQTIRLVGGEAYCLAYPSGKKPEAKAPMTDTQPAVAADAVFLGGKSLEEVVKEFYPDAKNISSTVEGFKDANVDVNSMDTPHETKDIDLAVVKGEFAVAENGAVWVCNTHNKHRAQYFLAQNIILVVDKNNVVSNMHEAYERVDMGDAQFGAFISGPSKTADIEQCLVIGAHGPRSGIVVFV